MSASAPDVGHNGGPAMLRSFVDRLVHLEEEKREIAAHIKDLKAEAKGCGFDKRVLTQMVKEALMSADERAAQREYEEICEVYRANLGMLGGTPLGQAARKRAAAAAAPARKPDPHEPETENDSGGADERAPDQHEPAMPPEDVEAAREKGREAGRNGTKIFANPYVHGDPRRAEWDTGWCEATGSDGMEVPQEWRRQKRPKPEQDGGRP